MKYNTILFDLDGTLTDPKEGIVNSVIYALNKYNIQVENPEELVSFIGPPLVASFRTYYAMDEAQAHQAVEFYREYFREKGIFENILYPGIPELLANLKAAGKQIVLATSKPTVFAEEILKHFDIWRFFDLVAGSNLDNTRMNKGDVIGYIMEALPVIDRETIVMVGDREHDVIGAKEHQLASIGVTFGYGSVEELQKAGATFVVESVSALQTLLLNR